MIISDLNHLEVVEANVVGGFGLGDDYSNVDFTENFKINKKIRVKVDIKGNAATAESDAVAYGKNTLAQIFTYTETGNRYSVASGTSISATK